MLSLLKVIEVGSRERALLIDSGRFVRSLGRNLEVVICHLADPAFRADWADWADVLVREHPEVIERNFTQVETRDAEVAASSASWKARALLEGTA